MFPINLPLSLQSISLLDPLTLGQDYQRCLNGDDWISYYLITLLRLVNSKSCQIHFRLMIVIYVSHLSSLSRVVITSIQFN